VKWIKHQSNAHKGNLLQELYAEFGRHKGYAVYWLLVEYLADKWDGCSEPSFKVSEPELRKFLGVSKKFLRSFSEVFEKLPRNSFKVSEKFVEIKFPKLLEIRHRDALNASTRLELCQHKSGGEEKRREKKRTLTGDTIRVRETAEPAPKPPTPPPTENLRTELKESDGEIQTLEDLRRKIPIVTRDAWARRYPDPGWLEQQIALAFDFHCADPSRRPRTAGQWMKKIITWLSIGWERRAKGETGSMSLTEAAARGLVTL
jgi:hypothetical protein